MRTNPRSPEEAVAILGLIAKCFGYLDDKGFWEVCQTLNEGLTKLCETKRQAKKMGIEIEEGSVNLGGHKHLPSRPRPSEPPMGTKQS